MTRKSDEANLMGQVAGILAVMSAIVQALPPTTRKRVQQQLHRQFDSLLTAMEKTEEASVESARGGAEWVQDLFLKQIADANSKSKSSKAATPAAEEVDFQL